MLKLILESKGLDVLSSIRRKNMLKEPFYSRLFLRFIISVIDVDYEE